MVAAAAISQIKNSMASPQNFAPLWTGCQLLVVLTYIGFGGVCYRSWGDDVHSIVTIELPGGECSPPAAAAAATAPPCTCWCDRSRRRSWVAGAVPAAAVLGFCVAMYLTYPIVIVSALDVIENEWFAPLIRRLGNKPDSDSSAGGEAAGEETWGQVWLRRTIRLVVVVLTGVASVAIPNFGLFLSLVGGLVCTAVAFVIPPAIHLAMHAGQEGDSATVSRVANVAVICFGLVASVACTMSTLQDMTDGDSGEEAAELEAQNAHAFEPAD